MHNLIAIYSLALREEINFAAHSATDSRKAEQVSCLASTDSYEVQLGHASRCYGKKAHTHTHTYMRTHAHTGRIRRDSRDRVLFVQRSARTRRRDYHLNCTKEATRRSNCLLRESAIISPFRVKHLSRFCDRSHRSVCKSNASSR